MAETTGSARLARSLATLVSVSDDPAAIASLLPGCEQLHRIDSEHIEGRLATDVSGVPIQAAVSIRRTVEVLPDGATRLHLRLKIRPDIGGQAIIVALVDLRDAGADATDASWRSSSELDPFLAVFAGQRVEAFLKESIERLISGLASA